MRMFIAIELPSQIQESLAKIEIILKKCGIDAKWVEPDNIHLTLKFLGEVEEERIEGIKRILQETANLFNSFTVRFKDFGFFPDERRPRVFFVSTDNEETLKDIAQKIEERLEKIGFPKEDRFKSHLTLARLKGLKNIGCLKGEIKNISLNETFPVKEITFFKSTLTKTCPIYEALFKALLK